MNPSHALPEVDHFDHLPLAVLVTSPTNPRKHFDPVKLQELAESIRATGVHQPILARPLPGSRLQETFEHIRLADGSLKPLPTHEIVSGERRFRACRIAGLATVPAMVRALTDEQVLEIQIIENLQRDDLTELEEAEGYEALMQHSGLNAEAVGAKIGKSRSYVYGRLKLLELGPDGREALRQGRIDASHALLIARIPDTKLQAQAVKDIAADASGETPARSYRASKRLVRSHYMLKLSDAPFDIHDASLVPASGSCSTCSKRTGADPDLFADVEGEDLCIDPPCHQAKRDALSARTKREAHERGQVVIDGREAKALMPTMFTGRVDGHCRLDDPEDSPTNQPLRAIIGKVMEAQGIVPVLIANPYKDGELLACLPNDVVAQLLKAAGRAEEAAEQERYTEHQKKHAAEKAEEEARREYETEWRWNLLVTTWEEISCRDYVLTWSTLMRYLATAYVHKINQEQCARLCKLLELGKVAPKQGMLDWVKNESTDPMKALLLLVMFTDSGYHHWLDESDTNVGLKMVAERFEIDIKAVQEGVKAATRAAVKAVKAAEAAKADLPLPPAAQASGVRGEAVASDGPAARGSRKGESGRGRGKRKTDAPAAPKAGEEEVRSGIAAAMRGLEDESVAAAGGEGNGARPEAAEAGPAGDSEGQALAVGKRVRLIDSSLGKAGKISSEHVSGSWFVVPDGLDCEYRFDPDELEPIADQEAGAQA